MADLINHHSDDAPDWRTNLRHHHTAISADLRKQYSTLSDDDLAYATGDEDAFVGRLSPLIGRDRRDIEQYIATFASPRVG